MIIHEQIMEVWGKHPAGSSMLPDLAPVFEQAKAYSTLCEFINGLDSADGGTAVLEQLLNFISNQEKE